MKIDELKDIIKSIIISEGLFEVDSKIKPFEKMIIDSVIDFMKSKYNFNAKIIVVKKNNNALIGDVVLNDNSLNKNKFYLHFNPNQSYKEIIKSLIHELTHVKQISSKELTAASDYKNIIWKDEYILPVKEYYKKAKNFTEYWKIPWEHEAYNNMIKLYPEFIQSKYWANLKGTDATIDYIMDNI